MQGWRENMEDAHFAASSLGRKDVAAFGVFDGHGGDVVASLCRDRLPVELGDGLGEDDCNAMVAAFEEMDRLLANEEVPGVAAGDAQWCGCTATVCLVQPEALVVANAGDCRAVLCREGLAVPLSEDHKPSLPAERERIRKAGGFVEEQQVGPIKVSRVNGGLSCSRAIGDLAYKANAKRKPCEQMVVSTPEVRKVAREAGDEFLILACDGVWDVISSQDAVDFVRGKLALGQPLSGITDDLLDRCLSPDLMETNGLGGDNMTAMLVVFGQVDAPDDADPPPRETEKAAGLEILPSEDEAKVTAELGINEPEIFVNKASGAKKMSASRPAEEIAPYFY